MFFPKLNDTFKTSAFTMDGFATLPTSFVDWLENVEKIADVGGNNVDLSNRTSFDVFLSTVSLMLNDDSPRTAKMMHQLYGRVRTKLRPEALAKMEERGFSNAVTIYLVFIKIRHRFGDVSFIVDALTDAIGAMQTNGND